MPLHPSRNWLCTPAAAMRRPRPGAWVRIIGVLFVGLALQACTAVKLGYNHVAELGYWWLDGYVDFTDEQAPRVREDLARLHQWHRAKELPRYNVLLQKMELMAPADTAPEQVCAVGADIRSHIQTLLAEAEPPLTTLAVGLEPSQLDRLRRKYAKTNAEFREEWIDATPKAQQDRRFKQVLERAETFYGKLDKPQRDVIRNYVENSGFDGATSFAELQRRQQEALQTLTRIVQTKPGLADARAGVHALVEHQFESPNPAFRAYTQQLQETGCRHLAALHNATTPEQREKALQRLRSYGRDFTELAARK